MKIAIELFQIIPSSSGGIVPQLANLLSRAFVLYPSVEFIVYAMPRSYRPPEPLPPNVQVKILAEASFWPELSRALLQDEAAVLFRSYPAVDGPLFPASRQIVLIPDLQHEIMPELFSPAVLEARRHSFPDLINSAGALCVYSEYSQAVLKERYPASPAETVLVPPGPSLELLESTAALTPAEAELIPDEPFLLYPANLWPHKNHRRLLEALRQLAGKVKVSLVLTGDPAGWPELHSEYAELPVRHLGYVSAALLQTLYRRAVALSYFSLYEGFGMPVLEAFALGTPVLCSNLPVLQEVGGPAVLSCDPTDLEAIAGLIERITSDSALRQELIAQGHAQAQHYSGDTASHNFVQACQRLAARPVEYQPTLLIALNQLDSIQQHLTAKEQVVTSLTNVNQERLELIQQFDTQLAVLKITVAERLELIQQLDTQLKTTTELVERQQTELQAVQSEADSRLAALHLALEQATVEKAQLKEQSSVEKAELHLALEQATAEKGLIAAELENVRRAAQGGDPGAITGVLDAPTEQTNWRGWAVINGWAFSQAGPIVSVAAFLGNTAIGLIPYGILRPDVAEALERPGQASYGFGGVLRLPSELAPGEHQLRVRVSDEAGNRQDYYCAVRLRPETRLRRLVGVRPDEMVSRRLVSYAGEGRRRELQHKARQNLVHWKNRLLHYHLGILQQHPPRPWVIPPHYARVLPPVNPPSISIVTPSYNQADFLERTLRSVLDQNYPSLEYIVQDGGSKDRSAAILQSYTARLAYWESARDKGQSNAINLGFQRSSGEIMAYLNSDDLLLPGTLNYVARYFIKHPEVDVVYGQRVIIDEHDQEIGRWIVPPHAHDQPGDNDILSWADYIPQETLFWRRRIWEKAGGQIDESFQFAMDWDLILRFRAAQARFVRLPRFLGAFRVHSLQKSSAQIADLGNREMNRLRERSLGRLPQETEIHPRTLPYLRKHVFYHKLYRLGILRY